jgi:hypothetical protein
MLYRFFVVGLIFASFLRSQTLDTGILGTIVDPSGATIGGVSLTIIQSATGVRRTVATAADGKFEVRYLLPGDYTAEAQAAGFRTERRTGIVIQIGQQARIDFTLQLAGVAETVEVRSSTPLLQTENATLGEVVGPERIVNLPLNGRNFADLAKLTPGVSSSPYTGGYNGVLTSITANGARNIAFQLSLDGVSVIGNRNTWLPLHPSIDAIQEFKVQSGNYSAEYGGNAGANVNVQLKSGTNRLHGSLFEYLRNNQLDARGYFRPRPLGKDVLRRNQFGAVVSGAIIKEKTFFMAGYEGVRQTKETPSTGIVIPPEQRRGDFSAVSTRIIDPLSGAPFPGNIIPANRLNQVSVNLANSFMPLPNTTGPVNFSGVLRADDNANQMLTRIDHYLSSRDQIFGHYIYQGRKFPGFDFNPYFSTLRDLPMQSVAFQHVHTFSPTLLNEFRFGYQRQFIEMYTPRRNTAFKAEDLGINGLRVGGPNGRSLVGREAGFPLIGIQGLVGMGDGNSGNVALSYPIDQTHIFQFVNNLSVIRGNHAMKMGVDARRLLDDACTVNSPFGQMSFTSDISGNAAAAFMLGYPRTVVTPEGQPLSAVRQSRFGFYFQDDWKISPKLTLNLGARYDLMTLPHEINGISRTLRFDLDRSGPVLWPEPGKVADLWNNEHWHIGPRIGFAYRLKSDTVVRGGYGIFTMANHFNHVLILQLAPPVAGSLTIINDAIRPLATIQNPVPQELYPQTPIYNVSSISPDRTHVNPYYQNWNLQVSRQFSGSNVLEAGYVGTKGTFLDTSVSNFNSTDPGPGDIQSRRPYPAFGRIRMMAADGNSIYHALQARYEHRLSKALSLTAAYNWSHMIDDQGGSINIGACQCQNPRLRGKAERADSGDDIRHRLVVGYVWDFPSANRLKGPTKAIVGGWSLGGIMTLQSGSPVNVTQSGDTQNIDNLGWSRPNLVSGQQAVISAADRSPGRWFNVAAFSRSVFEYGNSPRNPIVGPGVKTFDLSATKAFNIPSLEGHELVFRTEFFNAFNTPQFGNPGGTLGTGTFGILTSTKIDQRQIQFALKYTF